MYGQDFLARFSLWRKQNEMRYRGKGVLLEELSQYGEIWRSMVRAM